MKEKLAELHIQWINKENRPSIITGVYLVIMLGIFPLFAGSRGYVNITGSKYVFFMAVSGFYLLALLICSLGRLRRGELPRFSLRLHWPQFLLLIYGLLALISALLSPYQDTVWLGCGRYEGMLTLAMYLAVFFAVAAFGRFRPLYLYLLSLVLLINDILAVWQLAGGNPLGLYPGSYDYFGGGAAYSGQFLGTIGNVGLLAALYCLAVPAFICYFCRNHRHERFSWWLLAVAVCSIYVLLRSGVAAGILGLLAALALLPFLLPASRRSRWLCLLLLLILLGAGLLFVKNYTGDNAALQDACAVLNGEADDETGSGRVGIWRHTWPLLLERPLLGGGPDTLKERLDMVFVTQDEDSPIVRRTRVDNAHNDYLSIAVNTGVPSLAFYLAALILTAVYCRKYHRCGAVAVLAVGMTAYCVQIFFSFSLCLVAPLFWIFWGMLLAEIKHAGA